MLWLAGGVLAGILALLFLFIRRDIGFRIFRGGRAPSQSRPPEPMV